MHDSKKKLSCSAVILSGGLNSRMDGRNKAFLEIGGKTFLDRVVEAFEGLFSEMILVTREPDLYTDFPVRVVTDIYDDRSSLAGIHAGLSQMKTDFALVVPCDVPFIKPALVQLILENIRANLDVVVPVMGGYYQPLCAVYSKRCIGEIEAQMDQGNFRIFDFYDKVQLRTIGVDKLKQVDAELISFFNINTPGELKKSRSIT